MGTRGRPPGGRAENPDPRNRPPGARGAECAAGASPGARPAARSDPDVLPALFADPHAESVTASALAVLPRVRGAYSLVFMDERTLYAARDPQGFRPLVLGRLARGYVVASETAALD